MQGVIAPNGLLVDVWGMYPGRRHDEHMVFDSGVNTRMRDCQAGNILQYKIMGDKAYSVRSHIGSPLVGNNICDKDNSHNYEFLLSETKKNARLNELLESPLTTIDSDEHKGNKSAINIEASEVFHRLCCRHLATNFPGPGIGEVCGA